MARKWESLKAYGLWRTGRGPAGYHRPLNRGKGHGPVRHLRLLADRLGWIFQPGGWSCGEQFFTWYEADYRVKWDSACVLCVEVETTRPDFAGLETGLRASDTSRKPVLSMLFLEESGMKQH
eukprot:77513-Amphidinium_carterae.2